MVDLSEYNAIKNAIRDLDDPTKSAQVAGYLAEALALEDRIEAGRSGGPDAR